MKLMKKISAIVLSLCLCIPCFSLVAHAADGKISLQIRRRQSERWWRVKCVLPFLRWQHGRRRSTACF